MSYAYEEELHAKHLPDHSQFTKLYQSNRDKVYNYAFLITQSHFHAEEIVQEVFLKIWIYRHKWEGLNCFEAWLYTMMRNRTLDYLKKLSNERNLLKEFSQHTISHTNCVEESLQANECKKLIARAMDNLSPQRRLVYVLTRVQGRKRDEVAKMLGVSSNTVRVQMNEALKCIKRFLAKETEE